MTLLFSIKPEFAKKIISREKKYEYRKKLLKLNPPDYILIYSSNPIKSIVAFGKVERVLEENPIDLWEKTFDNAGITEDFFYEYFRARNKAFALHIKEIFELPKYLSLQEIRKIDPDWTPPQDSSYFYGTIYFELLLRIALKNINWKNNHLGELWRHSTYFTNRITDRPYISLKTFDISESFSFQECLSFVDANLYNKNSTNGFFLSFLTKDEKLGIINCPFVIKLSQDRLKSRNFRSLEYNGSNILIFDVMFDFKKNQLYIFSQSRFYLNKVVQIFKKDNKLIRKKKFTQKDFNILHNKCNRIYATKFKLKHTLLDKYISIESNYTTKDDDYITYRKRGNILETELTLIINGYKVRVIITSDGGIKLKRNTKFPTNKSDLLVFTRYLFSLFE